MFASMVTNRGAYTRESCVAYAFASCPSQDSSVLPSEKCCNLWMFDQVAWWKKLLEGVYQDYWFLALPGPNDDGI